MAVVIIVVFLAVVSFINVVNSINEELGKVTQPNTKLGMFMWSLKRNRVDYIYKAGNSPKHNNDDNGQLFSLATSIHEIRLCF